MQQQRLLTNEKGFALVLAVSMIGLLSLFGVWMLVESQTAFRVTASMERREAAFNLAEAALQLDYRYLLDNPPSPTYAQLVTAASPPPVALSGAAYGAPDPLGRGRITPTLQYLSYSTTAPPGWMLNWQGSASFFTTYYKSMGQGVIRLPKDNNATTTVSAVTARVSR